MYRLARELAPGDIDLKHGLIMPQRTNPFQELVARIQRLMAPKGAIVTESASVGEDGREIDILIETNEGPYRIKAVEVKDEGRKMSIEKFESILGKYRVSGGVNGVYKIVVITHKGFSKKVFKRAKLHDIDLFTLKEALEFDWSKFLPFYFSCQCNRKVRMIHVVLKEGQIIQNLEKGHVDYFDKRYECLKDFAIYVNENIAKKQHHDLITQLDSEVASTGKEKDIHYKVSFDSHPKPVLIYNNDRYDIKELSFDICFQKKTYKEMPNILPFCYDFSFFPEIYSFELFPPIDGIDTKIVEKDGHVIHLEIGKDIGSIMEWLQGEIFSKYSWKQQKINPNIIICDQNYSDGRDYREIIIPFNKNLCIRINHNDYYVKEIKVLFYTIYGHTTLTPKQYELKDENGQIKSVIDMQGIASGLKFNITSDETGKFLVQTRPVKKEKEIKNAH
ncbi:MAG: hypothetical protein ABSA26_01050 [Thermoguttaceae bacterium]|jgi:hypothetical protein